MGVDLLQKGIGAGDYHSGVLSGSMRLHRRPPWRGQIALLKLLLMRK